MFNIKVITIMSLSFFVALIYINFNQVDMKYNNNIIVKEIGKTISEDEQQSQEEIKKEEEKIVETKKEVKQQLTEEEKIIIMKKNKKLMLEQFIIEQQSVIDANYLTYYELPLFSPGFTYDTYEIRESKTEGYDYDFLIKLKSYDIENEENNEYLNLVLKYLHSKNMEKEELQQLKFFYGFFVCSKKNSYEIMKVFEEKFKIKTLYVFENLNNEEEEVYYNKQECDLLNQTVNKIK